MAVIWQKPALSLVDQLKEFSSCCTKLTHFLLIAFSEAGYYKFFVHINTTTIVVNFIHNGTSVDEFTAWYPVCYYFTVHPSAASGWTMVVQMRVPEISLVSGLQAHNKHDLCR